MSLWMMKPSDKESIADALVSASNTGSNALFFIKFQKCYKDNEKIVLVGESFIEILDLDEKNNKGNYFQRTMTQKLRLFLSMMRPVLYVHAQGKMLCNLSPQFFVLLPMVPLTSDNEKNLYDVKRGRLVSSQEMVEINNGPCPQNTNYWGHPNYDNKEKKKELWANIYPRDDVYHLAAMFVLMRLVEAQLDDDYMTDRSNGNNVNILKRVDLEIKNVKNLQLPKHCIYHYLQFWEMLKKALDMNINKRPSLTEMAKTFAVAFKFSILCDDLMNRIGWDEPDEKKKKKEWNEDLKTYTIKNFEKVFTNTISAIQDFNGETGGVDSFFDTLMNTPISQLRLNI